jgi:hypothetical protein
VKDFDGPTVVLPLVTIVLIALSLWLSVNRRRNVLQLAVGVSLLMIVERRSVLHEQGALASAAHNPQVAQSVLTGLLHGFCVHRRVARRLRGLPPADQACPARQGIASLRPRRPGGPHRLGLARPSVTSRSAPPTLDRTRLLSGPAAAGFGGGSGQALSASDDARAGASRLRRPVTKDARRGQ